MWSLKQEQFEYNWSPCGLIRQMSPSCDDCPRDSCRNSICIAKKEIKSSTTTTSNLSRSCSDLSTVNNICTNSVAKREGYVYKRRRLHGNSVALLSQENATASKKECAGFDSSITSENHPLRSSKDDVVITPIVPVNGCLENPLDNGIKVSGQQHLHETATILSSQIESVYDSVPNNLYSVGGYQVSIEAAIDNLQKCALEQFSNVNDRCSSSKYNMGHGSSFIKTEVEDAGECSSSDVVAEPFGEFISAKEMCISVLKSHGLLGGVCTQSACNYSEVPYNEDAMSQQSCKICGLSGNPLKMLICDFCEEAFHLSCCNPRVKKLSVDEWYCQPCFRKKPKAYLQNSTEKSFNIKGAKSEDWRHISADLNPISFMLIDTKPYTTGVRIGKDFQAEVPEWAGPIFDDYDTFGEPSEMDPTELTILNGWNCNKSSKPHSIGNWIQCREVLDADEKDEEIVCGKWRRAPLFLTQTDDWDCSCAVLWDPIHADCAVPQELETDQVLKHLKYIEKLRPRLAEKKQRTNRT